MHQIWRMKVLGEKGKLTVIATGRQKILLKPGMSSTLMTLLGTPASF